MGNGFCNDGNNERPIWRNEDGQKWNWDDSNTISADGSDPSCALKCAVDSSCLGYMTEDMKKCAFITQKEQNDYEISSVDSEKRNHCFRKTAGYKYMGNGFCNDGNNERPIWRNEDGQKWNWDDSNTISADGSDPSCALKCDADSSCLGYMTEDMKTCAFITQKEQIGYDISSVDSEKRNHCFKKRVVYSTKDSGYCEDDNLFTIRSMPQCQMAVNAFFSPTTIPPHPGMPSDGYTGTGTGRPGGCLANGAHGRYVNGKWNGDKVAANGWEFYNDKTGPCGVYDYHCVCASRVLTEG